MATYDLEEQEQLAELKAWWKLYGNLLINVFTAAMLIVSAWLGWNWYQRSQSAQASMVYQVLQKAVQDKDSQRLKAASGELLDKYSHSTYASLGALITAKAMMDSGDAKTGKLQLLWVVEHGQDELRDLARLRLAAVLLDEKAYDDALKQLDGNVGSGFAARFAENRGDVFSAQGKVREARAAYQSAVDAIDELNKKSTQSTQNRQGAAGTVYRELLQQKLDALGSSKQ